MTHCQGLDLHPSSRKRMTQATPHPSLEELRQLGRTGRNRRINDAGNGFIMGWINDEKFGVTQRVPKHLSPWRPMPTGGSQSCVTPWARPLLLSLLHHPVQLCHWGLVREPTDSALVPAFHAVMFCAPGKCFLERKRGKEKFPSPDKQAFLKAHGTYLSHLKWKQSLSLCLIPQGGNAFQCTPKMNSAHYTSLLLTPRLKDGTIRALLDRREVLRTTHLQAQKCFQITSQ